MTHDHYVWRLEPNHRLPLSHAEGIMGEVTEKGLHSTGSLSVLSLKDVYVKGGNPAAMEHVLSSRTARIGRRALERPGRMKRSSQPWLSETIRIQILPSTLYL